MDVKVMNNAANNLRVLIAEMVEKSKSGHPGGGTWNMARKLKISDMRNTHFRT